MRVESGEDVIVDIDPILCGGVNEAAERSITAWIQPARGLFPSTDVLAPEGP